MQKLPTVDRSPARYHLAPRPDVESVAGRRVICVH